MFGAYRWRVAVDDPTVLVLTHAGPARQSQIRFNPPIRSRQPAGPWSFSTTPVSNSSSHDLGGDKCAPPSRTRRDDPAPSTAEPARSRPPRDTGNPLSPDRPKGNNVDPPSASLNRFTTTQPTDNEPATRAAFLRRPNTDAANR